jgi:hypothetical protein
MKKVLKNLMTLTTIIFFSIIAVASSDDKSSESSEEVTNNQMEADEGDAYSNYESKDVVEGWTVYHSYEPSSNISDCNSKKCNWCGEYYYADDVSYIEHPDEFEMEALSDNNEGGFGTALFASTIDWNYIDKENKIIHTYWKSSCEYEYGDYCSRRCSEKY